MTKIGLACPQCEGCFSKQLDHVPDDIVIDSECPHCMYEFKLTLDETSIHIINLEEVRRLRRN